ncbi:DUF1972 domain-containing protein [Labrys wisconsinensis]|uniref:DUF1972 domain-containing protein n=1 Tax=Labrys wisconsinensis TaxID=425677 RepID=UPI0027D84F8F|nr:DUF1972 domain-containing protein [Labrys wisconsinensis]
MTTKPQTLSDRSLLILGTRGIPAAHGGFETFAERLALFLVGRGWKVTVYCQQDVAKLSQRFTRDEWRGVDRVHVQVTSSGPRSTLEFDALCVLDAARRPGICLVLGYNGAAFLPYLRLRGRKIITNMDGIEWRRPKWGLAARTWFWVNEWIAAWTSHRLVADHPAIANHLATRRSRKACVMIPYGADPVRSADVEPVLALGLEPDRYLLSVARIEPDNNILTMVEAFSRSRRGAKLVVLGKFSDDNPYHKAIRAAASEEVLFPGAIYIPQTVKALRFHARAYLHGHTVGGTNPSLVESLWAGNVVIAHDNTFNRWTAGDAGFFFRNVAECDQLIAKVLHDDAAVERARRATRARGFARFAWADILEAYETEFLMLNGETVTVVQARPSQHEVHAVRQRP